MEANDDLARLDMLGLTLGQLRSEAIAMRQQSGIEQEWMEDQEFYEGIDDKNRGEAGGWRGKPWGQSTPVDPDEQVSSSLFANITRAYCDAASARVGDMLLPTDDKSWAIKPTPIPEMSMIAGGKFPAELEEQIDSSFARQEAEGVLEPGEGKTRAAQTKQEAISQEAEILRKAKDKARAAETQIEDWFVEGQWSSEARRVIEAASQTGTGVLKGPVPFNRKTVVFNEEQGALEIIFKQEPGSKCLDVWNCYPDLGCGDSIHSGNYHFERDEISRKEVTDLLDNETYIQEQIRAVLEEGPTRAIAIENSSDQRAVMAGLVRKQTDHMFEIWYGYCEVSAEDFTAAGMEVPASSDVSVYVVMINNHVVLMEENLLDTGEFPYDYFVWQRRSGLPFGIGVARQVRSAQRMLNGSIRNMMDNAGIAAGPMIVVQQGVVSPADGVWEITPRKLWLAAEDADTKGLAEAFKLVVIPMLQKELEAIMLVALRHAEDATGMPMLLQGQMGKAPDTLGGMTMLNNNASTVLRRIARLFDDLITEPHVRRYYTYLLQYGDDTTKGDLQIDARGSSALVERDLQNQSIMSMASMVLNPIYGLDPKKWAKEALLSQKLDYNRFSYDDEEWQQVVQNMSQPTDPRIQVAEMRKQVDMQRIEADLSDNAADREIQQFWKDKDLEIKALELQLKESIAAGSTGAKMEAIKGKIATVAMEIKAQREANDKDIARAVVEPAGRAPDGEAYLK